MGKHSYKLNRDVARQIMKSEKTRAMLKQAGESIAGRAGEGFKASTQVGWDRHRGKVEAATTAAKRRQARDHVIERAAGGGL